MKVTRDVITDIWPVYQSGEASADTRSLVEEFLAGDPEFAKLIRESREEDTLQSLTVEPSAEQERETLLRVKIKRLIRYRTDLIVAGIVFPIAAAFFRYGRVYVFLAAVLAWVGVWLTERQIRKLGF